MVKLPKVTSLSDLRCRASVDARYAQLAVTAAENLGHQPKDVDAALRWLNLNADETSEAGVVGEVNFVRDLVS